MLKKISILFISLLLMSCGLIPNTYLAAPISGTVIDDETEKPIAGVNVVVYWQLHKGGFGGRVASDILYVEETVTNGKGKYHLKGWGPTHTSRGRLGYESPELLFFKQGYYYQHKGNSRIKMNFGKSGAGEIHIPNAEKTDIGLLYRSQFDGRYIRLKKGSYSEEKYIDDLEFLSREISRIVEYKFNCKEKTIFKSINYIRKQVRELHKLKIRHYMDNPDTIPVVRDCI